MRPPMKHNEAANPDVAWWLEADSMTALASTGTDLVKAYRTQTKSSSDQPGR